MKPRSSQYVSRKMRSLISRFEAAKPPRTECSPLTRSRSKKRLLWTCSR
jgi:hypothetical protein